VCRGKRKVRATVPKSQRPTPKIDTATDVIRDYLTDGHPHPPLRPEMDDVWHMGVENNREFAQRRHLSEAIARLDALHQQAHASHSQARPV